MVKKYLLLLVIMASSVRFAHAADPAPTPSASAALLKDPATGIELVYVKGGCFQMGDQYGDGEQEEKPVHEVCVGDFYMGKYEVTQGQWITVMGNNPADSRSCGADCPVVNVSWNDVQEFIVKLNSRGSGSYRLPTEAEFEYAARSGGKSERYAGGNDMDSVAWYNANSGNREHPVGSKLPNGLSIHDMAGNVWEWTGDWYGSDYYASSPRNNPAGPGSGTDRVKRGGCAGGPSENQRVSRRTSAAPDFRIGTLGFRLVKMP